MAIRDSHIEELAHFHVLALEGGLTKIEKLERALDTMRTERDDARAQLQAIGRKAFWAAKESR